MERLGRVRRQAILLEIWGRRARIVECARRTFMGERTRRIRIGEYAHRGPLGECVRRACI
jgi:hypothetical protein